MSDRNTCSSCQHYREGLCCRFPPLATSHSHPMFPTQVVRAFVFPDVRPDDSCGEYQRVGHNMGPQVETRGGS